MSNSWPQVPLGEVLTKSEDWTEINPTDIYREITVRLWGKGVTLRREVEGSEIASTTRLVAKAGQFILSRIDARNGAFGVVPDSLDGAVVSNDFPLFTPNPSRLLPPFLDWMSKTGSFVEICKAASVGTTNRVRLQEDRFLTMTIPLPPLSEQRRIVARIDELAAKIDEARTLRRQGEEESGGLVSTHAGQVFAYWAKRYPPRKFGSFSPHVTSGPRNWAKHYETSGYRFYRAQDIDATGKVSDDSKVFIAPPPGEQGRSAMLQTGDLMLVITGATVGRVSTFREGLEPGFVSQHVAICRLPREAVDPAFALWGLRTLYGQEQLLGQRYGQGKPGLNLSNIRNLSLPFPPPFAQRRIVAELDTMQARVDALKKLQAETAAEVDALLPSILDRAFRGVLV